jgi:hypothetical protein
MDSLTKDRLQFRNLLSEHGLIKLAGGQEDALSWLEAQIIELADSVARREQFRELLRQTREMLTREQGARPREGDSPGGERTERPNPHIERRYRRVRVLQS